MRNTFLLFTIALVLCNCKPENEEKPVSIKYSVCNNGFIIQVYRQLWEKLLDGNPVIDSLIANTNYNAAVFGRGQHPDLSSTGMFGVITNNYEANYSLKMAFEHSKAMITDTVSYWGKLTINDSGSVKYSCYFRLFFCRMSYLGRHTWVHAQTDAEEYFRYPEQAQKAHFTWDYTINKADSSVYTNIVISPGLKPFRNDAKSVDVKSNWGILYFQQIRLDSLGTAYFTDDTKFRLKVLKDLIKRPDLDYTYTGLIKCI